MLSRMLLSLIAISLAWAAHAGPTSADADFFKGKTVTIVTSTGAGGIYDLVARLLGRYMPRYIPGTPTMIVQNMPGGGDVLATNYMYSIAPKDGTVIASIDSAIPLHQALGGSGVRFDASKFNWLGSTGPVNQLIIVWHTAGITTIEQAMEKQVVLGGAGVGSQMVTVPMAMNNVLGTKFEMVIGYKSSAEVDLAIERGEVQARAISRGSIVADHPDWLAQKKIVFIAQAGAKRETDLPDTPLLTELATTEEQKQVLQLVSSPPALGHPFLAPPGVPADRMAVLQRAFDATLKDEDFVVGCTKLGIDVDPMSHEIVSGIVQQTIDAPPDIVAKTVAAVASPGSDPKAGSAARP